MAKTGLQNEQLISELLVSGSLAIKTKNDFGIHVFSGSVATDGIVSGKLTKPKYNEVEVHHFYEIIRIRFGAEIKERTAKKTRLNHPSTAKLQSPA